MARKTKQQAKITRQEIIDAAISKIRRKPSRSAGEDIRRKARKALKINQALIDSEHKL